MMWLKNFERVQEIQQQIQWQPVTELEPRAFIPEVYGFCSTLDRFDTLVSCCSHFDGGAENAKVDNAGVDNSARRRRGGHRGSGQRGTK